MGPPPTAEALPTALVDRDQWVCWRTQQRDDTTTKVPIIPGTTQFASTTDPDTWRSFATAHDAATATSVDGLGFVFTADDPLVGIDLDDCRDPETGEPTARASRIINRLESYTEVSPSGTGYHVLVTGTLPEGRNRSSGIELYDRSRFFTVTGDHVTETPTTVTSRSDAIAALHADAIAADTSDDTTQTDGPTAAPGTATDEAATDSSHEVPIPDEELLDRARDAANGAKFGRLWHGDTSDYESHSEADMALCRLLAFWTGCDRQRIDRLFRRSGLCRDKWDDVHYADGRTYGETTIQRAIAHTDDVYTPPEATAEPPSTTQPRGDRAPSDDRLNEHPATDDEAEQDADPAMADASVVADESTEQPTTTTPDPSPSTTAHPERAEARLARIEELTDRVEALLAENERLRTELSDERDRRYELEAALEADESTSRWPF
jgi:primase-polymerase (primpol)-like protein